MQTVVGNNNIPLIYSGNLIGVGSYVNVSVTEKKWDNLPSDMLGRYIWYGPDVSPPTTVFLSMGNNAQKVLDSDNLIWSDKTWPWEGSGSVSSLLGNLVWRYGNKVYLSAYSIQKSLSGGTWYNVTWRNYAGPYQGDYVWTYDKVYNSRGAEQYAVSGNPSTNDWSIHQWGDSENPGNIVIFYGDKIWQERSHIYLSSGTMQSVLNISESKVYPKKWNGLTSFDGIDVWSNGTDIFYSNNKKHYVLDTASSTWYRVEFGINFYGRDVWTDLRGRWYVNNTHELHFN